MLPPAAERVPALNLRSFTFLSPQPNRFLKPGAMSQPIIMKIISGGQTSADRAALDFAIKHAIPYGGWCPKGRRAEDGPIDAKYQLQESPSSNYTKRTKRNARDSDGTVIRFVM